MLKALHAEAKKHGSGGIFPIRLARKHTKLPKEAFDLAALRLYNDDKIILHHHDYPIQMSAEERAGAITDPWGNVYHAVGVRI